MELRRTANAGVLLKLDGVSILLDGVCREVSPYPATPPEERALLTASWPDVVAFTHAHKDHYDPVYAAEYQKQTNGVVLGPQTLPGVTATTEARQVGAVKIMPIPSRHIGAAGKDTPHVGFVIEGTKTVWFTGDASVSQWKGKPELPAPDVVIVPYAYANTPTSWAFTKSLQAQVVLLHMPVREQDTLGLWAAVEATTGTDQKLHIPAMSQTIFLTV